MKTVSEDSFKEYGKILSDFNFPELATYVLENIEVTIPEMGNTYYSSVPALEQLPIFDWLKQHVYGGLDIQLGTCAGHNKFISAVEYHQGSEVVIALTDCIISVGHSYDIKELTYDSKLMKYFLLKKGEAIELYGTTLHYSPIELNDDGYATLVALIKGTNDKIEGNDHSLLLAKNKFMLVHESRTDKIENGAVPGFIIDKWVY